MVTGNNLLNITEETLNEIMSIRLMSNGLRFVSSDSESKKILNEEYIDIPLGLKKGLSEVFFTNEIFKKSYSNINIYYEAKRWILIPKDIYEEEKKDYWIKSIVENNKEEASSSIVLDFKLEEDDKVIVSEFDKEIYNFLNRNMILKGFIPFFSKDFKIFRQKSLILPEEVIISLNIGEIGMDFFIWKNGQIFSASHFDFTNVITKDIKNISEELLYFTLTIFNSNNLSNSSTPLIISIDNDIWNDDIKKELIRHISKYLENIELV